MNLPRVDLQKCKKEQERWPRHDLDQLGLPRSTFRRHGHFTRPRSEEVALLDPTLDTTKFGRKSWTSFHAIVLV
jgi:hypothetical protein